MTAVENICFGALTNTVLESIDSHEYRYKLGGLFDLTIIILSQYKYINKNDNNLKD